MGLAFGPDADALAGSTPITSPAIILVDPQMPENIGAAARAMANFGLDDLRLVAPREGWPNEKAIAAASGARVVEGARVFASVTEAVADLHFVGATTARPRDMIKPVLTPASAIVEAASRISAGQRCGFLFGGERWGLNNDDIARADVIVMAPVNPAFASLNLAQAVLLVSYEWLKNRNEITLGRHTVQDGVRSEGLDTQGVPPATKAELTGLFEHLESALDASGFLFPPEKRPHMVRNIRNLFGRMQPTEQDVKTLRGIIKSLARADRPR